MEISIAPQIVEKLSHSIEEIRVRALNTVQGKVSKALINGSDISFNGVDLIRGLLGWFHQENLCQEEVALQVIFLVLNSKYGPEIVEYMTKDQLRRELSKIRRILREEEHLNVLGDIESVIEQIDVRKGEDSSGNVPTIDLTDDLPSFVDNLNIEEVQLTPREYVKCWSVPNAVDHKSIRLLRDSLDSGTSQNFDHALDFLSTAIEDYPPEYFLQPPYLVVKFQELLSEGQDIEGILCRFNTVLKKRIQILASAAIYVPAGEEVGPEIFTQISVSKYCQETFIVVNSLLKSTEDQSKINWCFKIFGQLVDLLTIDGQRLPSTVEFFLKELGLLAKFFRKCLGYRMQDFTSRKLYIKVLQLIVKLKRIPLSWDEDISSQELSIARLDIAVKSCYPDIYHSIEKTCPRLERNVQILLNCEEILLPAVTLLRPLEEFSDEDVVTIGVDALKSSNIHQSIQLAEVLINSVVNCIPFFPGNTKLRDSGEKIVLHLLAHPCPEIKRFSYQKASEKMKFFVSSLIDGQQIIGGRGFSGDSTFRNLGIPLTREILTEITVFGCSSSDPVIHSSAEIMLIYILKSRVILKGQWKLLKDLLFPILPLLQCWTTRSTKLGEAILSLLHPDSEMANGFEVTEATVRLLFSPEPTVRDEAVSRILYIVNSHPQAKDFLPKIPQIADTVTNDIALLEYQIDMAARFRSDSHQAASVENLLIILRSENVEPSVRKTTVMQLNLLAMDPCVNDYLMSCGANITVLEILDNCFKVSQTRDYVDICVPAIGILSKLLLHCPVLRKDLSEEINVYFIILRSLLMFHHDDNLRTDAATALFLLSFSTYTIGSYSISLPRIMSKLKIPFLPQFHWSESPHTFLSPLEEIFFEPNGHSRPSTADSIPSDKSTFWQFLRISFASIWFNGLENILMNARQSKRATEDNQRINYNHVPTNGGKNYKMIRALDFADHLKMTKKDLLLIHASLPMDSFRYFIHQIENSTTHQEVSSAIAHIQCNLTLDPTKKFPMESLVMILKKFCLTPPSTSEDCDLFGKILQLFRTMLDHESDGKARQWLIDQIKIRNSTFTSIFLAPSIPLAVYQENARLLTKILGALSDDFQSRSVGKDKKILGEIFRATLKALEKNLENSNQMNRARILMDLLVCLSCKTYLEIDNACYVVNRVLRYTMATKSLCQGGSKFILNCLLTVRGLMDSIELSEGTIKTKYIRYISGLCGHSDVWIRQASWMILCKWTEGFAGAYTVIEELKFLPGGFHACCIGTLLDNHEAGCVREMAACTFSNLVSHRTTNSGSIAAQVSPRCSESDIQENNSVENLIMVIVRKHRVAEEIVKVLANFSIWDAVQETDDTEEKQKIITDSNAVHGFCVLLKAITEIDSSYINVLMEENCLQSLATVLALVPTNPSNNVFRMASGICTILIPCILHSEEILQCIVGQNHATVGALLFLQDETLYSDSDSAQDVATPFIKILSIFGTCPAGFNIVTNLMQEQNPEILFSLATRGLLVDSGQDFQLASVEFFSVYLRMGIVQENGDFLQLIDPKGNTVSQNEENLDPNAEEAIIRSSKNFQGEKMVVTVIFQRMQKLFETLCSRDKPEIATFRTCNVKKSAGRTLGILLSCSPTSRSLAKCSEFLSFLLKRLEDTSKSLGSSCADFVRQHGEVKKKPIVSELILITDILCGWFSADLLENVSEIDAICRIMLKLWTWSGSTRHLQINFWLLLKHLSEQSYIFCRKVSMTYSGFPQSILQLMITATVHETNRAKQHEVDISRLSLLLRFLSNCSSSIESRMAMVKQGLLDNISQFHPSVTRLQRPQGYVIEEWLKFYEILSRYPEGESARHLTVLAALIPMRNPGVRRKAIEILRNFAFADANTAALLASEEFLRSVKYVLDERDRDDQRNIAAAIWSIIENNHRAKTAIKTSSIPRRLMKIQNSLIIQEQTEESNQLYQSLECISKILN